MVLPAFANTEMIAGVGRATGFKTIEPEVVGKAVVRLIVKPRTRVVVPRSFGIVALAGRRFMPQRVYEAIDRGLGVDRVFLGDVDVKQRRDYVKRTGTS